ncbi:hypothetical protein [Amycolatopsis sp. NPDC059021]
MSVVWCGTAEWVRLAVLTRLLSRDCGLPIIAGIKSGVLDGVLTPAAAR